MTSAVLQALRAVSPAGFRGPDCTTSSSPRSDSPMTWATKPLVERSPSPARPFARRAFYVTAVVQPGQSLGLVLPHDPGRREADGLLARQRWLSRAERAVVERRPTMPDTIARLGRSASRQPMGWLARLLVGLS